MADAYFLESGDGRLMLEDGSGAYLLESSQYVAATTTVTTASLAIQVARDPVFALKDDFSIVAPAKWIASGQSSVSGKYLFIVANYNNGIVVPSGYESVELYDLRNSTVTVEARQLPSLGSTDMQLAYGAGGGQSNRVALIYEGGTIWFERFNGSTATVVATAAYTLATPWWRLRHDGTTIYGEVSADRNSWTTIGSFAASLLSWTPSAHKLMLTNSYWQGGEDPVNAQFDNFNIVTAAASTAVTASLAPVATRATYAKATADTTASLTATAAASAVTVDTTTVTTAALTAGASRQTVAGTTAATTAALTAAVLIPAILASATTATSVALTAAIGTAGYHTGASRPTTVSLPVDSGVTSAGASSGGVGWGIPL